VPVGSEEFLKALGAIYPQKGWRNRPKLGEFAMPLRSWWGGQKLIVFVRVCVGLAISGGVDSMALATLYSTIHRTVEGLPVPHCIIVDHKARPESTEEAKWVAEELRSKRG